MDFQDILEAVNHLDNEKLRLLRQHIDQREQISEPDDINNPQIWIQKFHEALASLEPLPNDVWDEIEWAMNVEFIEPFVDEE